MTLTVIGATSEIAQATARAFVRSGHRLLLVARDTKGLSEIQFGKSENSQEVSTFQCDVSSLQSVKLTVQHVINELGDDPYVLVAVGSIKGEENSRFSPELASQIIDVNFRNVVVLITPIAEALKQKRKGCIVIISSVSGDRGRQSNYVYGSAKAGLSAYAQGLRNRLFPFGVHVLTVKPGYVDTKMLREALGGSYDRTPGFLIGDPEKVGTRIYRAALRRENIIYVQPIWRLIMFAIRIIPESMFKKLHL
jgi:hypothetical protein